MSTKGCDNAGKEGYCGVQCVKCGTIPAEPKANAVETPSRVNKPIAGLPFCVGKSMGKETPPWPCPQCHKAYEELKGKYDALLLENKELERAVDTMGDSMKGEDL